MCYSARVRQHLNTLIRKFGATVDWEGFELLFRRRLEDGSIKIARASLQDMAKMLGNLSTSTSHKIFADCDVVVEAVTENEKLKTAMYQHLGKVLRPGAILASNTSTISITRMAAAAPDPAEAPKPDEGVPAPTNIQGKDYPRVHNDLRVTFRIKAPDANKVEFAFFTPKRYPTEKDKDGNWTGQHVK